MEHTSHTAGEPPFVFDLAFSSDKLGVSGIPFETDAAHAVNSLNGTLQAGLQQLSETLASLLGQTTTLQQIELGVFLAIIGAFSAFCFNYLHWKMVSRRERTQALGVALSSLIEDLEKLAVEYWTQDYSSTSQHQNQITEVHLKSKLRLVPRYVDLYVRDLRPTAEKTSKRKLKEFPSEIFDLVTGDEFESKSRNASKQKASKITFQCSDIRVVIMSLAR